MAQRRDELTRRGFLRRSAAGIASVSLAGGLASCSKDPVQQTPTAARPKLPTRTLGKTGLEVSTLSFGGGSQFLKNADGEWEPMLERAVDAGITIFDTSSAYQWGASTSSEERFGLILPKYRDRIILSTKVEKRDLDEAKAEIARSLERMKTDKVDILLVHSIEKNEDMAALEKGVWGELVRMKEQGVARFIGFSSMNSAEKSREMLEAFDIDVCILAMNPTGYGDFARTALPAARDRNVGVIAMKVMRDLVGKDGTTPKELMDYALQQPGVATAVIAHVGLDVMEQNLTLIKEFEAAPTARVDCRRLEQRLAKYAGSRHLCWARPDYFDGMMC